MGLCVRAGKPLNPSNHFCSHFNHVKGYAYVITSLRRTLGALSCLKPLQISMRCI